MNYKNSIIYAFSLLSIINLAGCQSNPPAPRMDQASRKAMNTHSRELVEKAYATNFTRTSLKPIYVLIEPKGDLWYVVKASLSKISRTSPSQEILVTDSARRSWSVGFETYQEGYANGSLDCYKSRPYTQWQNGYNPCTSAFSSEKSAAAQFYNPQYISRKFPDIGKIESIIYSIDENQLLEKMKPSLDIIAQENEAYNKNQKLLQEKRAAEYEAARPARERAIAEAKAKLAAAKKLPIGREDSCTLNPYHRDYNNGINNWAMNCSYVPYGTPSAAAQDGWVVINRFFDGNGTMSGILIRKVR